jgi:hypothetical protein
MMTTTTIGDITMTEIIAMTITMVITETIPATTRIHTMKVTDIASDRGELAQDSLFQNSDAYRRESQKRYQ